MTRRLLNLLTILSLVLCTAAVAMWVRSYFVRNIVTFGRAGGNGHVAQSILGNIHVLSNLDGGYGGGASRSADRLASAAIWNGGMSGYPPAVESKLGFVWQHYTLYHFVRTSPAQTLVSRHRLVVVPWWAVVLVFAAPPGVRWALHPLRPRPAGTCRRCGYDLRATPDRCPECGMAGTT